MIVCCNNCKEEFECSTRRYNWNIKKGINFYCSSKCFQIKQTTKIEVKCNYCNNLFLKRPSEIGNNNFCSHSCSASYNNVRRQLSVSTKEKISESLIEYNKFNKTTRTDYTRKKVQWTVSCSVCSKEFSGEGVRNKRKTCSRECTILATTSRTYQNGSRKSIPYYNKWKNKTITLESSWEERVAIQLDSLNIKWIRPKFIRWIDIDNKSRLYYPDFYLIDYNLYLDPKNEYCLKKDEYKLSVVTKEIELLYGHVDYVLEKICSLEQRL